MSQTETDAVAVRDADDRVIGEVSCDLLLRKGVPPFFSQLPSVAFARNFDPFDRYFADEAHSTAGDLMTTDYAAVEEDATLMEIVYLLAVRGYPKVYVLCDHRQVGVIDRALVLDRIFNL
jgi:CBS domain-containing protein